MIFIIRHIIGALGNALESENNEWSSELIHKTLDMGWGSIGRVYIIKFHRLLGHQDTRLIHSIVSKGLL